MTSYEEGQKVVVKSGEGYINEGLTGVLRSSLNTFSDTFADVVWDEGQDAPLNGFYLTKSFDFVEDVKPTSAEVISELLKAVEDEAYERGLEAGREEGSVKPEIKIEIQNKLKDLDRISNEVVELLSSNNLL